MAHVFSVRILSKLQNYHTRRFGWLVCCQLQIQESLLCHSNSSAESTVLAVASLIICISELYRLAV